MLFSWFVQDGDEASTLLTSSDIVKVPDPQMCLVSDEFIDWYTKITPKIDCNVTVFFKSCYLWRNICKYIKQCKLHVLNFKTHLEVCYSVFYYRVSNSTVSNSTGLFYITIGCLLKIFLP